MNKPSVLRTGLLICALMAPVGASWAKVEYGANILRNGTFECDQLDFPPFWSKPSDLVPGKNMHCLPSGGPGGKSSIRFMNSAEPLTFTIRQGAIKLVPGARYRLSAKVRTKGFKAGSASGIIVINAGWYKSVGITGIRPDQDWTPLSREFAMIPSKDEANYRVTIYFKNFTGEIEIADVKLEALDEAARAGSEQVSPGGSSLLPRLVPVAPVLCRIPSDSRRITFRFFGLLPHDMSYGDCDIVLNADDAAKEVRRQLVKGVNDLLLPDGAKEGRIRVRVVQRADGKTVTDDTYRFKVVTPVVVEEKGARRLNNLVTELLRETVAGDDAEYAFSVKRDAWVYMALRDVEGGRVDLDGEETIGRKSLPGEAFRFVAAGSHSLRVRSANGGMLIVRRVPEIFNYPSCCNSRVKGNPPYDWDFHMKHVFPVCTTMNGGSMPVDKQPLYRERGGRWLANLGTTSITNADDLVHRLSRASGMTDPRYDGLTCDEQFFGSAPKLSDYTIGLKRFSAADTGDRLIYTWIVGKPKTPGLDEEFAAACINASRGRGRALFEIYCRTCATEKDARQYLEDYLVGTPREFSKLIPGAADGMGVILGNFNQMPVISLVLHPEVDYKYFLDMQFNIIANNPTFESLGCVGYWGSYYADEEMFRWSMALLRHYCVEGRRTMLSSSYGYSYLPGMVVNGDFRKTLEGWNVSGDVGTDAFDDLGKKVEKRWGGAGGLGDTFASFAKTNGVVSTLSQRVKGLVPGRLYCLQACTFDIDALRAAKAIRSVPLSVSIARNDCRIRTGFSWHHVDTGKVKGGKNGPKANVLHTVFEATSAEATIEISNAAAPDVSRLGVNAISLNPYFSQPADIPAEGPMRR